MPGSLALDQGNLEPARRHLDEGERMFGEQGDTAMVSLTLLDVARFARMTGDYARAGEVLDNSVRLLPKRRDVGIHDALNHLRGLAIRRGEYGRGVRLFAAAARARPTFGMLWTRLYLTARADWGAGLAKAALGLGDQPYAVAWAKGQALTPEQAVACALGENGA